MKLFISKTSPYARICRAVVIEKGLSDAIEIATTDPWASEDALLAQNPFSKIPTLVLDDGRVLTECLLITAYLDASRDGTSVHWAGGQAEVMQKLGYATGIIDAAVAIASAMKFTDDISGDTILERRQTAIDRAVAHLDALPLSDAGQGSADIGDLALGVALGYLTFRFPDNAWRDAAPKAARWYDAMSERPALKDTMPG